MRYMLLAALAAMPLAVQAAQADGPYPGRPIRFLVTQAAGGNADFVAHRSSDAINSGSPSLQSRWRLAVPVTCGSSVPQACGRASRAAGTAGCFR